MGYPASDSPHTPVCTRYVTTCTYYFILQGLAGMYICDKGHFDRRSNRQEPSHTHIIVVDFNAAAMNNIFTGKPSVAA